MFQNVKLMSLFAAFSTRQSHFPFSENSPTQPAHQKLLGLFPINIYPVELEKNPGKEVGSRPLLLLLSQTSVFSDSTFRVFSVSLKFAVLPDRYQRRLFGLPTRFRQHSIHIGHRVLGVETSRPFSLSLRGSSWVCLLPTVRKTQRGLCIKHNQPSTHQECFHDLFAQDCWKRTNVPWHCSLLSL